MELLAKTKKGTDYVILKWNTDVGGWQEGDSIRATGKDAALREAADDTAQYVAIPARSWKPTKVTVETSRVVKFG